MKLSTDSYKGVRDFYPEDMAIQNQIFDIWKGVVEKYGYQEYSASVLEPADLYRAKSGEEIVNEQTYTFKDRGDREVTLRPEMTPTVARMVAGKKRELAFPLRWFSIPNLFRYEQPQRGRLREHWQLNVDIFGIDNLQAEVEIIQMAYDITLAYGLNPADFEIRINNRKLMNYITKDVFKLDDDKAKKLSKLIDKKEKLPKDTFELLAQEILNDKTIYTPEEILKKRKKLFNEKL
jgi:histidyl-tRNA synthetase